MCLETKSFLQAIKWSSELHQGAEMIPEMQAALIRFVQPQFQFNIISSLGKCVEGISRQLL